MNNETSTKREEITSEEQLRRWVAGESVHRLDPRLTGGECCPDFSCCRPELLAEKSVREAFSVANQTDRLGFLGNFLGAAMSSRSAGSDRVELSVTSGSKKEPQ